MPWSVLSALSSEAIARAKLVEREGESTQSDQLRGGNAGKGGRGEVRLIVGVQVIQLRRGLWN